MRNWENLRRQILDVEIGSFEKGIIGNELIMIQTPKIKHMVKFLVNYFSVI
jgi:hypothetical protein